MIKTGENIKQDTDIKSHEKWCMRERAMDDVVSSGQADLGTCTDFKYHGSDKELTVGDIVACDIDGERVECMVVDVVFSRNNSLSWVKVRDYDGDEAWGNPHALTLLRSYRTGDSDPNNNEIGTTDKFCPFAKGRCRSDCILSDEMGFCSLLSIASIVQTMLITPDYSSELKMLIESVCAYSRRFI